MALIPGVGGRLSSIGNPVRPIYGGGGGVGYNPYGNQISALDRQISLLGGSVGRFGEPLDLSSEQNASFAPLQGFARQAAEGALQNLTTQGGYPANTAAIENSLRGALEPFADQAGRIGAETNRYVNDFNRQRNLDRLTLLRETGRMRLQRSSLLDLAAQERETRDRFQRQLETLGHQRNPSPQTGTEITKFGYKPRTDVFGQRVGGALERIPLNTTVQRPFYDNPRQGRTSRVA